MTATLEEYDFLITTDAGGIKQYKDIPALNNNIGEWFQTPQGTMADMPQWGNLLHRYKHAPIDEHIATQIEIEIAKKMERDITGISVYQIKCIMKEIDLLGVFINYGLGVFEWEVEI